MTGSRSSRRSIDEGFDLTWDDITLGEELGAGSFGKAYAGTLKRDTKYVEILPPQLAAYRAQKHLAPGAAAPSIKFGPALR